MTKLEKMLKYVSEHNDFYKNRIKEYGIKDPLDITQWPVLTRKELQENRYNMFSDGYKSQYFNQQLRRQASSGSSGIPVNVYWDSKSYFTSMRALWAKRFQHFGIRPNDRQVMFALHGFNTVGDKSKLRYVNSPNNILNFNVSSLYKNSTYEEMIDIIDSFQPVWLYVRPFILNRLINSYLMYNKSAPSSLKYIESHGEILTPETRCRAEYFFNVPIANMYGSEEINTIAYECPHHKMKVLNDNVYLECLDNNGIHSLGEGRAIVTNLNNKAMPLIRYDQGDDIVLSNAIDSCTCDPMACTISIIKGRTLDSIIINDNIELNSVLFLEVMGEVNNHFGGIITCYKYVYNHSSRVLSCFVEIEYNKQKWFNNVTEMIEIVLKRRLPSISDIDFEIFKINGTEPYLKKHRIFEVI